MFIEVPTYLPSVVEFPARGYKSTIFSKKITSIANIRDATYIFYNKSFKKVTYKNLIDL